jgi:hypothetical protein
MLARVSALSVIGGVAVRANAPVAVIPASWQRPDVYPGAVVVGVEEASSSHDVVRGALDGARRTHSGVRLVQCWWISQLYNDLVLGITPALRTRRGSAVTLRRTSRRPRRSTPDVEAEIFVAHAPSADLLVSESRHAVLVVVGRHHAFVPLGSHLGPIALTVLRSPTFRC